MYRDKTLRAAASSFLVLVFFHFVWYFCTSEKSKNFNSVGFILEIALITFLGIVVFVITKDPKP